jgi:hypothetical protein
MMDGGIKGRRGKVKEDEERQSGETDRVGKRVRMRVRGMKGVKEGTGREKGVDGCAGVRKGSRGCG